MDFQEGAALPPNIKPEPIMEAFTLTKQTATKICILSNDGKEMALGLNGDEGDKDLFGHEGLGKTIKDRKKQLESNLKATEVLEYLTENVGTQPRCS